MPIVLVLLFVFLLLALWVVLLPLSLWKSFRLRLAPATI